MSTFIKLAAARWKREYDQLSPANKNWLDRNVRPSEMRSAEAYQVRRRRIESANKAIAKKNGLSRLEYLRELGQRERDAQNATATFKRVGRQFEHTLGKFLANADSKVSGLKESIESLSGTSTKINEATQGAQHLVDKGKGKLKSRVALGVGGGLAAGALGHAAYKHFKKKER